MKTILVCEKENQPCLQIVRELDWRPATPPKMDLSLLEFSKHFEAGWQMLRERMSGAHRKVRVFYERNIRYFVAKLSIVVIYALFERLSRAFNESHPAFVEFSKKAILLL